jgi:uncharacterized oxidoreductase
MKSSGNTILITGGTGGIGLELARQLLAKGNTVIITGRTDEKIANAKKQLPGAHGYLCDVSRVSDIETLHEKVVRDHPTLNILINNAGIMRRVNFHKEEGSLEDFTAEIDTNFKAPVRMAKRFLPQLKKMPEAAIVNVSSGLAFVPLPISPIYCATKAAMHSFSLSLRIQLKNTRVRVFELAPPATGTDLLGHFDSSDMKGVPIMKVDELVSHAIRGIEEDRFEIRPGQSNQLKFMSRVAPNFILGQLGKTVDRMLAEK